MKSASCSSRTVLKDLSIQMLFGDYSSVESAYDAVPTVLQR